ncbi:hypothetical protein GC194_05190 [bacterium]|nr:hypothetical protein [bacterium]
MEFSKVSKPQRHIFVAEGKWIYYRSLSNSHALKCKKYQGLVGDSLIVLSGDTMPLSEFGFCNKRHFVTDDLICAATAGEGFASYLMLVGIWIFNDFDVPEGVFTTNELLLISTAWVGATFIALLPNIAYIRSIHRIKTTHGWEMKQ